MPTVSAVITVFNRERLVRRAVDSALAQTRPPDEVVVVDDASTDGTAEAVRAIADPRVRLVRHRENLGGPEAMWTGFREARGELVAPLDSDDEWLPPKLERQLAAVGGAPAEFCSYTQLVQDDGLRRRVAPARARRPDEAMSDYLLVERGLLQTGTLLLPRALALATPPPEGMRRHLDTDLALRLDARGTPLVFVPEALTLWHADFRADRLSRRPSADDDLAWLALRAGWITSRARAHYLATTVAVGQRGLAGRLRGLGWVARARARGTVDTPEALRLAAKALVTDAVYAPALERLAGLRRRLARG